MFNFLTYNKFKQKKWERLSPSQRLKAYQKMEKITAKKVGRPCYEVLPKDWTDGTMGLCVYNKKTIYLNSMFIFKNKWQFYGLATLFHEQRHAQQHFVVKTKKKIFRLSKTYKWQQNMMAYIQYEGDEKYSYYSMQEIERDANKNAIHRLRKFKFRFRNEKLYWLTLREKERQFEEVKENAKKELGVFYKFKLFLRRKKEERKNKQ